MENEQKNYLLIISCCFLIGCLISLLLINIIKANYSYGEFTASKRVITGDNTGGRTDTTGTILKAGTTSKAIRTSKSTKETNKRGAELILDESSKSSLNPLWAVGGGWLGENEFERVINRMIFIGVETGTAEFIAWKCYATAKEPKNCVNGVIGISTAEGSLFQHCYKNNCFGIKPRGQLAGYDTLNEGIDDWINRYNKNWFNNHSAQDYILRSNYCVGDCSNLVNGSSNWTRAWRSNVNKMGF